jgi:hypothetical protein
MVDKRIAPIYTVEELRDLAATHDRCHPDHANGCNCHNGLIATLRTYFAVPLPPPLHAGFREYVPPELRVVEPRTHGDEGRKPWLNQRDDETHDEYQLRLFRSCYNCGTVIAERELLHLHEDQCSSQGRRHD